MFDNLLKISEFFLLHDEIKVDDMVIIFELPEDDLLFLNKELYVKKNGNLKNFVKNEEIELKLNDVNFIIRKK